MPHDHIRVIAICLFQHEDKILVCEYFDSVKGTPFYRPLGGAIEFGETTEAAIKREVLEEIGQEVTDLKLLEVLENLFTHEGKPGHEIVYLYDGCFKDANAYRQKSFTVREDTGETFTATWRSLDFFNDYHRLVPETLIALLQKDS